MMGALVNNLTVLSNCGLHINAMHVLKMLKKGVQRFSAAEFSLGLLTEPFGLNVALDF